MDWKRLLHKTRAAKQIILGKGKPSFSQFGEDRILDYLFYKEGISLPSYLDIGANEPILGSNTFYFYNKGARGVLIEPDPALAASLRRSRPKDKTIQVGIGLAVEESLPFYSFSRHYSGWNTFSKEEALLREKNGVRWEQIIKVPLKNVNAIIEENFEAAPDLISIDVEGLDFDIVKSLDFALNGPLALVLETLRFGDSNQERKEKEMIEYVCSQGYQVFGDTWANTIFKKI